MAQRGQQPDLDFDLLDEEADLRGEGTGERKPQLKDWALLVLDGARRRKLLFFSVLVIGCGFVVTYYRLKSPVYRVEAKILAQRQQVLPSTLRGASDDNPTRTAWELIHRRENLIALVQAAGLAGGPAPVEQRSGPSWPSWLPGAKSRTEPVDPLDLKVKLLDRLLVVTAEEGTITIRIDWPEPQQAYRIVDTALQNFIEARHVQEVTAIDEVLSVLRARAAKAREDLERVTDEVRRESTEGVRDAAAHSAGVARPAGKGPGEELVRLKSLIEAKERAIQDVEDFRRRRLADLHAQLDERRNTYSDAHPVVIQLRQDIDALSKDSSQVVELRQEQAKLREDLRAQLAREGVSEPDPASAMRPAPGRPATRSTTPEEDERVRDQRFQYQQIMERVNSAQLELDAVRAAFKYRYNVIWPPQMPTDPVSPNPKKVFGVGFLGAVLLALLLSALADLRSGRIVQRWQVERGLGLPILAEIDRR